MPEEFFVPSDVMTWIGEEGLSGRLDPTECLVLLSLASFPEPQDSAIPIKSISSIAEEVGCGKKAASCALRKLVRLGYVRQMWKRGLYFPVEYAPAEYHRENGYQIILPNQ
jgi:hypothetical protein